MVPGRNNEEHILVPRELVKLTRPTVGFHVVFDRKLRAQTQVDEAMSTGLDSLLDPVKNPIALEVRWDVGSWKYPVTFHWQRRGGCLLAGPN